MSKVFISYSWDSEEHKKWVLSLAVFLKENDVEVIIDRYDLLPGDRLPLFMEKSISESDYVLIICTPKYKEKADKRNGGVGYESNIITGELVTTNNERKFIPIIRFGNFENSMPRYLSGKYGINLKDDNNEYENELNDLLATVKNEKNKKSQKRTSNLKTTEGVTHEIKPALHILGIITDEVTLPRNDGTRGSALYSIPFRLSDYPSDTWSKLFIDNWNHPFRFSTMHRPGIASVIGNKIILNGTTIEEVQKYHRDTLVDCVEMANRQENQINEKQKRDELERKKREEEHKNNIDELSKTIKF